LSPATATNTVGATHCVTATVTDSFSNPTPGVLVRFSVTPAISRMPPSGSATTNASGQAQFCYTPTMAGADAIHAYADTNGNNMQDAGEPFGDAIKAWIPGQPAKLTLSPATATNNPDSQHCVTATVTDTFNNPISGV